MEKNRIIYYLCLLCAVLMALCGLLVIFIAKNTTVGTVLCSMGGIGVWVAFIVYNWKNKERK